MRVKSSVKSSRSGDIQALEEERRGKLKVSDQEEA